MPNVRIIAKGQRGEQLTKLKVNFTPEQSTVPSLYPETNSVYLTRATEGTGELMELVGGTVAWNQLCNSSSVTGTSGHKFYLKKSGAESITNTNTFTGLTNGTDMVTDLTQMLGPTIADYVYSLEQATAGSGIAWLKKYDLIDDQYHAFSDPTLQSVEATSHVTVGKNLAPYPSTENGWENGYISGSGTIASQSATQLEMTSDYIPIGDAASVTLSYTLSSMPSNTNWCGFGFYADKSVASFVSREANAITAATSVTLSKAVPSGAKYFRVTLRTYGIVDTLQAEYGSPATAYVPYAGHTTPLANITLRGMLKTDADGNLYYDGDTYEWDGTVTRKYGEVDLGSLNWYANGQSGDEYEYAYNLTGKANGLTNMVCSGMIVGDSAALGVIRGRTASSVISTRSTITTKEAFKTAMNGVGLVYELATQTTESADPFTAVQTVEDGGTEEFVTTNGVPVGVVGRFANAVPMEGVDSFSVTANDGTSHTYPVTLSEEIYRGYVDMLTGEAISDMASIAEYNGETISEPWLSSLDVYSAGATPTKGAQVVYPITPEEVTATITGDPTELGNVGSVSSTEGTVDWGAMAPLDGKCIVRVVS